MSVNEDEPSSSKLPGSSESLNHLPESGQPECAVCYRNFHDKSTLDPCSHNFCFKCIEQWLSVSKLCPLCKTSIKFVTHGEDNEPKKIPIACFKKKEIVKETENITNEKRIINVNLRYFKRLASEIDENTTITADPSIENQKAYVITVINGIHMLKDDIRTGTPKNLILAKKEFRKLIYNGVQPIKAEYDNVIEQGEIDIQEIKNNVEKYRNILVPFFMDELSVIPVKSSGNLKKVPQYVGSGENTESIAQDLFKYGINNKFNVKKITNYMKSLNISIENATTFTRETCSILKSKTILLDYCRHVTYTIDDINKNRYRMITRNSAYGVFENVLPHYNLQLDCSIPRFLQFSVPNNNYETLRDNDDDDNDDDDDDVVPYVNDVLRLNNTTRSVTKSNSTSIPNDTNWKTLTCDMQSTSSGVLNGRKRNGRRGITRPEILEKSKRSKRSSSREIYVISDDDNNEASTSLTDRNRKRNANLNETIVLDDSTSTYDDNTKSSSSVSIIGSFDKNNKSSLNHALLEVCQRFGLNGKEGYELATSELRNILMK